MRLVIDTDANRVEYYPGPGGAPVVTRSLAEARATLTDRLGAADTALLPVAVRAIGAGFVLYERPPTVVRLRFQPGRIGAGRPVEDYELALPWQVYGLAVSRHSAPTLSVFARPGPLMSLHDALYQLPLPNSTATGACTGQEWVDALQDLDLPLGPRAHAAVGLFWQGEFNVDIPEWAPGWRLPEEFPQALRERTNPATIGHARALLRFWARHDLDTVLAWHWAPVKNVFGDGPNTCEQLIAALARWSGPRLPTTDAEVGPWAYHHLIH